MTTKDRRPTTDDRGCRRHAPEAPFDVTIHPDRPGQSDTNPDRSDRSGRDEGGAGPLIFCGMCGALNPAGKFFCAACGTTLVDAFHATEGLRVFERADSASRLIEIVPSGNELDVVEDPNAPGDFVRVRLMSGKLGYIRLQDAEANAAGAVTNPGGGRGLRQSPAPNINTNARGCVTPAGALFGLALVLALGALMIAIIVRSDTYDRGTMGLLFCFGIGPLLLLTVALYLYARSRDDRMMDAEEEARLVEDEDSAPGPDPGSGTS